MRGSVETLGALMRTTVHKSSGGTTRQGNPSGGGLGHNDQSRPHVASCAFVAMDPYLRRNLQLDERSIQLFRPVGVSKTRNSIHGCRGTPNLNPMVGVLNSLSRAARNLSVGRPKVFAGVAAAWLKLVSALAQDADRNMRIGASAIQIATH